MADISAISFILLIIGIAFPAMLTAWWLLFPSLIARAQTRVEKTPWQTFWLGLILIVAAAIPIVILLALPFGPAKFIGWILLGASLAISTIGSAGIAAHLGARLSKHSDITPLNGIHPRRRHPRTRRLLPSHRLALRVDSCHLDFLWRNWFCLAQLVTT
ncbi:MAG: hypothetical protein HND47_06660 [Chloroflexi bacterium]|nr:hypothetical protein [Chloroflexota bacterium]